MTHSHSVCVLVDTLRRRREQQRDKGPFNQLHHDSMPACLAHTGKTHANVLPGSSWSVSILAREGGGGPPRMTVSVCPQCLSVYVCTCVQTNKALEPFQLAPGPRLTARTGRDSAVTSYYSKYLVRCTGRGQKCGISGGTLARQKVENKSHLYLVFKFAINN